MIFTTFSAAFVFMLSGSMVLAMKDDSCPMQSQLRLGQQYVWLLDSDSTRTYPPNVHCEWTLQPPKADQLIHVDIFNMNLLYSGNKCSGEITINGEKLCYLPRHVCKIYETNWETSECAKKAQSKEYDGCTRYNWTDPTFSIKLNSFYRGPRRMINQQYSLVYKYINCTDGVETTTTTPTTTTTQRIKVKKSRRTTTTLPTSIDHTSAQLLMTTATTVTSQTMYSAIIPVGAALLFIIGLLMYLCLHKKCQKCCNKKIQEDIYEYAQRDGITILPDATSMYSNYEIVDPRYEVIGEEEHVYGNALDTRKLSKISESEKEVVDNVLYEHERIPQAMDNVMYEMQLELQEKDKNKMGKRMER